MERTERSIQFEELGSERTFASAELQERANGNPLAEGRKQYRVWLDDSEAAYLTFDTCWEDQLNLYEVFVATAIRNQGVGTKIIRFALDLARKMGKPRLTVRPEPLSEQSKPDLIAWCTHQGFTPTAEDPQLLEIPPT
jgi:GNAT superfamily N-acetyltransferase